MLSSFIVGDDFVWPPVERLPEPLAVGLATRMLMDSGKVLSRKLKRPAAPFKELEDRHEAWSKRVYMGH